MQPLLTDIKKKTLIVITSLFLSGCAWLNPLIYFQGESGDRTTLPVEVEELIEMAEYCEDALTEIQGLSEEVDLTFDGINDVRLYYQCFIIFFDHVREFLQISLNSAIFRRNFHGFFLEFHRMLGLWLKSMNFSDFPKFAQSFG